MGSVCSSGAGKQTIETTDALVAVLDDINLLDSDYIDKAWQRAKISGKNKVYQETRKMSQSTLQIKRSAKSGWRTIRIFVSSTFKDFHQEREILVKKVFPDLRQWCLTKQLHLIDCDLRWGVPKDSSDELVLKTCLGEIDRCYKDNVLPFFLNMTSERMGWLPSHTDVPPVIRSEYEWVDGLSITEMEIIHAAYRVNNPNALFMLRDPNFLDLVPESERKMFVDGHYIAPYKLRVLREILFEKFPSDQTFKYNVSFEGLDEYGFPMLSQLEENFAPIVLDFFKNRINAQYPEINETETGTDDASAVGAMSKDHELFCRQQAAEVIPETEEYAYDILEYVNDPSATVPLFVYGSPGAGKSTRMSRWAEIMLDREANFSQNHRVFCHFVGAVPDSTNKFTLMLRLGHFFKIETGKASGELEQSIARALSKNDEKIFILIDAINQLATETKSVSSNWLPSTLAENVRVVVSMVENSDEHKNFQHFYPSSNFIELAPLNDAAKRAIVTAFLEKYSKTLNEEQTSILLANKSSANPLWLSLACEELRVFGYFRKLTDKIKSLRDDLLELECQILERFEFETSRDLLIATCSLLEVSNHGLLESELLDLLADELNLLPPQLKLNNGGGRANNDDEDDDIYKDLKSEKTMIYFKGQRLASNKWAEVFRVLRPFIRPYGNPGEGRLDFYHRSFSKAVRMKYFFVTDLADAASASSATQQIYSWWRRQLIRYFERSKVFERRVEELPLLLAKTNSVEKLQKFVLDWKVINKFYEKGKFCKRLHDIWLDAGGLDVMAKKYLEFARSNFDDWKVSEEAEAEVPGTKTEELARDLLKLCYLCTDSDKYDAAFTIANEINSVLYDNKLVADPNPTSVTGIMKLFVGFQASAYQDYAFQWSYMEKSQMPHIAMTLYWCQLSVNFTRIMNEGKWTKDTRIELADALGKLSWNWGEICFMGNSTLKDAKLVDREDVCSILFHDPNKQRDFYYGTTFYYAEKCVNEAIAIYDELNSPDKKGNALISKAYLFWRSPQQQEHWYQEAERVLDSVTGGITAYHQRLWLNWAMAMEEAGKEDAAYDLYMKTFKRSLAVNGLYYAQTRRVIEILNEPHFMDIAEARGDEIPAVIEFKQDFALAT